LTEPPEEHVSDSQSEDTTTTSPIIWADTYTPGDMRKFQLEDPDIQPLLRWLEGNEPTQAELFLDSPATKSYWLRRSQLSIEKGVLYCQEGLYKCLIVPANLRNEIF
jgi:hypothetical protein